MILAVPRIQNSVSRTAGQRLELGFLPGRIPLSARSNYFHGASLRPHDLKWFTCLPEAAAPGATGRQSHLQYQDPPFSPLMNPMVQHTDT